MKHLREQEEENEPSLEKHHKLAERVDKRDRVILKNEEEREVFQEVFDRQTLILCDLVNRDALSYLNGVISSGKEARVYAGVRSDKIDSAVKIYLAASSDYKRRLQYAVGDPRFNKLRSETAVESPSFGLERNS
jgi:serine/threonine-protein kinase RIO1